MSVNLEKEDVNTTGSVENGNPADKVVLKMSNIQKRFDNLEVLKAINLTVKHGEVVSIIGPSGSGKSTLLRCATFLEKIDSGEIIYLDKKAAITSHSGKVFYTNKADMKEIKQYFSEADYKTIESGVSKLLDFFISKAENVDSKD